MTRHRHRLAGRIHTGLGCTACAAAAIYHGIAGLLVSVAALIVAKTIIVLAEELFWLRALSYPSRNLHALLDTAASVDDAERLMWLLHCSHRELLRARVAKRQ